MKDRGISRNNQLIGNNGSLTDYDTRNMIAYINYSY